MRPALIAAVAAATAIVAAVAAFVTLTVAALQLPENPPPVEPIRLPMRPVTTAGSGPVSLTGASATSGVSANDG